MKDNDTKLLEEAYCKINEELSYEDAIIQQITQMLQSKGVPDDVIQDVIATADQGVEAMMERIMKLAVEYPQLAEESFKEEIIQEMFGEGAWDVAQGLFLYDAISTGIAIAAGSLVVGGIVLRNKIADFAEETKSKLADRKYLRDVLAPAYKKIISNPELQKLAEIAKTQGFESGMKETRPELFTKRGDVRKASQGEYDTLRKEGRNAKKEIENIIRTTLSEEEQVAFNDLKNIVMGTRGSGPMMRSPDYTKKQLGL